MLHLTNSVGYDELLVKKITVKTKTVSYPVLVERGAMADAGKLIAKLLPSRKSRCFIISASPILSIWREKLTSSLSAAKIEHFVLEVPDGERSKNASML